MPEKKLGVLGGVLAALAVVLAVKAGAGFLTRQEIRRTLAADEAQVERMTAEQKRLKAELEALEHDPIYLERVLRDNRRVGPGEAPPPPR